MNIETLKKDLTVRTSRSGGKGGQNVNKVETKVELLLDLNETEAFSDDEKTIIFKKLKNKISKSGILSSIDQTTRSQLENRALAEEKLIQQIEKVLIPEGPRLPTMKRSEVKAFKEKRKQELLEAKKSNIS